MYSDNELIQIARNGNFLAEEILAKRYSKLVRISARQYFLMGGDREDLNQEGMLGLLSAIRSYDVNGAASFKTYAERCIHNRLISAIESAERLKHAPLNSGLSLDAVTENESLGDEYFRQPEELLLEQEKFRELRSSLLGRLSSYEADVLKCFLDGMSYKEIAAHLQKTEKSVDNAVQRIRKKFADEQ